MNNHYAKIRAALELADNFDDAYSTSSERDAKNDAMAAAITALTELERMAGEPVAWQRDGFTFRVRDGWDAPPDGAVPLYAAPPIPQGDVYGEGDEVGLHRRLFNGGVALASKRAVQTQQHIQTRPGAHEVNHVPVSMYATRILDLVQKRDIASDDYIAKVLMDYGAAVLAANAIAAAPQPQVDVYDYASQLNDRLIESVHECHLLRDALASTNAGLKPTADQCVRIAKYAARVSDSTGNGASWEGNGRAIVAMVREVMGGGE